MTPKIHREEKEIERLYRENRSLKREVRHLQRALKQINKGFRKLREDDVIEEADIPKEIKKMCWECVTGELIKKEVLGRYWRECSDCGKRTTTKMLK